MVTLGRFELPTCGLGNRCSIHLSYGATRRNERYDLSLQQFPSISAALHDSSLWSSDVGRSAQSILAAAIRGVDRVDRMSRGKGMATSPCQYPQSKKDFYSHDSKRYLCQRQLAWNYDEIRYP